MLVAQGPKPAALQYRLFAWFDRHRRPLPWRQRSSPYRVWLAEIMLQQTRVATVVPYYRRFLKAFPSLRRLARAREEQVLRLWAGLGYYERARNLHRTARKILRRHRGRFPRTLDQALALPGIGPYTARAILSIAYRQPVAVVDGNVARVLARLYRLSPARGDPRAALQDRADRLVSPRRPGDFNQAFMELGSTLCLPRIPKCPECPLERLCLARRAGLERVLPRPRRRRPRPRLRLDVLVVEHQDRFLVVREPGGLFSGLWSFPYGLSGKRRKPGIRARGWERLGTLTHSTTMRDLVLRVFRARASGRTTLPSSRHRRWVRRGQLQGLGVGAATRKIAAWVAGGAEPGRNRRGGRGTGFSGTLARMIHEA